MRTAKSTIILQIIVLVHLLSLTDNKFCAGWWFNRSLVGVTQSISRIFIWITLSTRVFGSTDRPSRWLCCRREYLTTRGSFGGTLGSRIRSWLFISSIAVDLIRFVFDCYSFYFLSIRIDLIWFLLCAFSISTKNKIEFFSLIICIDNKKNVQKVFF